jgi:hypothetical protein
MLADFPASGTASEGPPRTPKNSFKVSGQWTDVWGGLGLVLREMAQLWSS